MKKSNNMIDVYSWPTPNGHKVHIMLGNVAIAWVKIGLLFRLTLALAINLPRAF